MNKLFLKKYRWLLLLGFMSIGFMACSESDEPLNPVEPPQEGEKEPYRDEKAYANFFSYSVMSDVYLWKQDITAALNAWPIMADPIEVVAQARYKHGNEDVDKWTEMTDSHSEMVGGTDGISTGTYGMGLQLFLKEQGSEAVVGFITYTYPDSPAEEAGLNRGDVILQVNGEELNLSNYYNYLFASESVEIGIGRYLGDNVYSSVEDTLSMKAIAMYENPVLLTKVFDCGGKKVGYLAYTSFTFESSLALYDACKEFKKEGISELILDLRYNGGGYVFTEEVLASMLAPENEVKNKSVFETEIWNDDYMAYYEKNKVDLNTYFRTSFKQTHNNKQYDFDTSDANLGLTKIYALVTENSASASEAILVGLKPYMDIEIIGTKTHGKYCSGIMWKGEEWYQEVVDNYQANKRNFVTDYPQFAEWKKYIGDWGIYVMISMYADKDGNNPCMPDGLTPDVEAKDLFEEPYPLGDEREAMLNVALQRAGKTDLKARVASRSAFTLPVGKALKKQNNPLDGKRIYATNRVKARIQN